MQRGAHISAQVWQVASKWLQGTPPASTYISNPHTSTHQPSTRTEQMKSSSAPRRYSLKCLPVSRKVTAWPSSGTRLTISSSSALQSSRHAWQGGGPCALLQAAGERTGRRCRRTHRCTAKRKKECNSCSSRWSLDESAKEMRVELMDRSIKHEQDCLAPATVTGVSRNSELLRTSTLGAVCRSTLADGTSCTHRAGRKAARTSPSHACRPDTEADEAVVVPMVGGGGGGGDGWRQWRLVFRR